MILPHAGVALPSFSEQRDNLSMGQIAYPGSFVPSPGHNLEVIMDVGIQMIFSTYGWSGMSDREVWQEEIRLARLADELGFDVLWSVEHHFFDYSFCPDNTSSCRISRRSARTRTLARRRSSCRGTIRCV
jgi:hypothetical protein